MSPTLSPELKAREPGRLLAHVVLLALVAAGCGRWPDGRVVGSPNTGGALKPSVLAYAVATPADVAQAEVEADLLPSCVDLRRDGIVPPIQNQQWNSCVGWTLGYFLMTGVEARHYRSRGYVLDIHDTENWFSPDYLYSQRETTLDELARFDHLVGVPVCFESDGTVGCMRPERALQSLMTDGCCRWPCLCGPDEAFRTCDADAGARTSRASVVPWALAQPCGFFFRPRCFVRFGTLDDPDIAGGTVRQMQTWLHGQGTPIAAVVRMRENWLTYRGGDRVDVPVLFRGRPGGLVEGRGVCLDAGGRDLGGQHMMTIIGYDRDYPSKDLYPQMRDDQRGSFLVTNQWGEKWGDRGTMWIPAVELQKIWIGGYGIIKWNWEGPIPGGAVVCAQDPDGRWIELSEPDDVPRNLRKIDPACVDPCARETVETANELSLDASLTARSGSHGVGGVPAGAQGIDAADWFVLELPEPDTRVDVQLEGRIDVAGGSRPLRRVLDVRITDDQLRDLTERDPATGEARAFVCAAGRVFVKVQPNEADLYGALAGQDPRVAYEFTVRLTPGQPRCTDPATRDGGAADPLRTHTYTLQTIRAGEDDGRRFHWFDASSIAAAEGWGRGVRMQVQVAGLAPGARLEVVVGGIEAPRHRPIDVFTADERGGGCLVTDETVIVGPPDLPRLLAVTRSLTPDRDVSYALTIAALPALGSAPPETTAEEPETAVGASVTALDVQALDSAYHWGFLEAGPAAGVDAVRVMHDPWGFWAPQSGWRDHVLELRHACPAPRIELVGPGGAVLPAGVHLADAGRSGRSMSVPGVTYWRLVVPPDFRDPVLGVVRDESGEPLREYSLRTLLQPSLRTWPLVEGPDNTTDGAWDLNNGPTHPVTLVPGMAHADTIGFFDEPSGYSWDLFDYFVVENPGAARTATVSVAKDTLAGVLLRWWEPDGRVVFHGLGQADTGGSFSMNLAAGERKLLMMYSGTQASTRYTIEVTAD